MTATTDQHNNPLAEDFTVNSLLRFALPSIVMMLFMGLYTIGDTIIISRYVSTDGLSALNIVTPIISIIVGLGSMLATGGSAVVAKKMGEGSPERAAKDFTLIILSGAFIGLIIATMGIAFADQIVWRLGASQRLFVHCKTYLSILLLFTPASIMQVLFQNFMVTAGKPGLGMMLAIGAGGINVLLDYILVVPLKMGIAGSAIGTGVGCLIPSVIGVVFFTKNKGVLRFCMPKLDLAVLKESSANGFSEMLSQVAMAITTFLFNITMMRLLGENGVAAITIIIYTQFLLTTLYIGFSMGVAPIISYNYGGKFHARLKRIFKICLAFIGVVSVLVFLVATLFGPFLISVFSPQGTQVYVIARQGFMIVPFSFLFCGFNIFASATFTALSDGKVSAIISFLRTFVLITPALLILPTYWGVAGVWVAIPIAELITVTISAYFIHSNKKKYGYL